MVGCSNQLWLVIILSVSFSFSPYGILAPHFSDKKGYMHAYSFPDTPSNYFDWFLPTVTSSGLGTNCEEDDYKWCLLLTVYS